MQTKLQAWMQVEGLSDTDLAVKLEMDRTYIWRLRTGDRLIPDAFRWRFAQAFGEETAIKILGAKIPQPEATR